MLPTNLFRRSQYPFWGVDRLGACIGKGTWLVVACALWLEEEQEDPIRVEGCGGSMGGIGCDGGGDWKEKGA